MTLANPGRCSCPGVPGTHHLPCPSAGDKGIELGWGSLQNHQESLKHKGLSRIRPTVLAAGWQ